MNLPWQQWDENGETVIDTLDDSHANVFKCTPDGKLIWARELVAGGGHCFAWSPSETNPNIQAIFNLKNYRDGRPLTTYSFQIDPQEGAIIDSFSIPGWFIRGQTARVKESNIYGYTYEPETGIAYLLYSDGTVSDPIRMIRYGRPPGGNPGIFPNLDGDPLISISIGDKILYYGIDARLRASIIARKMICAYEMDCDDEENTWYQYKRENINYFNILEPNPNRFWWFRRHRWELITLLVVPIVLIAVVLLIKYLEARRRAFKILVQAKQELEIKVQERTQQLADSNDELESTNTHLKQLVEQLDRHRHHLETIFHHTVDGMALVNKQNQLIRSNEPFHLLFGLESPIEAGTEITTLTGTAGVFLKRVVAAQGQQAAPLRDLDLPIADDDTKKKERVFRVNTIRMNGAQGLEAQTLIMVRDVTTQFQLNDAIPERATYRNIIGASKTMQTVYRALEKARESLMPILVTGESGTGKELIADAIHHESSRRDGPFIKVNCAGLAETLIENELFGHAKGAYTGAMESKEGLFEAATDGTLFLDEIGDMSLRMQGSLLRVLESGEFARVGEYRMRKTNARVITATNKPLEERAAKGKFREDLFFRLSVMHIKLPPLRQRKTDIPLLADAFLDQFNQESGSKSISRVAPEVFDMLQRHSWPGNVRELKHVLYRAWNLCDEDVIQPKHLPDIWLKIKTWAADEDADKKHILHDPAALEQCLIDHDWVVKHAADHLGVARNTVHIYIKKYNLKRR